MTQIAQISCITKQPRNDPYTRITAVGGVHNGQRWRITLDDAIANIEAGAWQFYTLVGGHRRPVQIATRLGRKYLRTDADYDTPDNLLSLPECPQ